MDAGSNPGSLLPIWLSARGLRRLLRTAQSLEILQLCGRLRRGSMLLASALAAVGAWEVNQCREDLTRSPLLCISDFPIKINKSLKNVIRRARTMT